MSCFASVLPWCVALGVAVVVSPPSMPVVICRLRTVHRLASQSTMRSSMRQACDSRISSSIRSAVLRVSGLIVAEA